MMRSICSIFILFFAILQLATAQMRVIPNPNAKPLGKDTICYQYTFFAGDTLIYFVDAQDSVLFPDEPALLKIRREHIRIVCDSVSSGPLFHLTFQTIDAIERQTVASETVERSKHPWIGRISKVTTTPTGLRLQLSNDNPNKAVMGPGGAFSPLILPPLDTNCGVANQSWQHRDSTILVENGAPGPIIDNFYLWRVLGVVDTLGKKYNQIQYTQNGVGYVTMIADKVAVRLAAIVNGYGKLSFDPQLGLPYHVFAVTENKLEISTTGERERKGKHLLRVDYQLQSLSSKVPGRSFSLKPQTTLKH